MAPLARSWTNIPGEAADAIHRYLIGRGGQDAPEISAHEVWRTYLLGATFTLYRSGTLYSTASAKSPASVTEAWTFLEKTAPSRFVRTDRAVVIGFDESGKSEVAGDVVLAGVLIPREVMSDVEGIVALAKTKSRHPPAYWDRLTTLLHPLKPRGLRWTVEKISPHHIDAYNLNGLFDLTYSRILRELLRHTEPMDVRVVLDDYRTGGLLATGGVLSAALLVLGEAGADVVAAHKADDQFIEARAASVVARHGRERVVAEMNADSWVVDGCRIGAGHAGHPDTVAWLQAWKARGHPWPPFIRRSSAPIAAIDGRSVPTKPQPPPDLLEDG